ncbi:MAG: HYR domain-containing protein [Saprospiraceae bacterium]|nr:HYR domain-containing protein [Saprospiraceae bacterium]
MKQKPILFLSLVLITALCAVCAPKGTVLDFFTKNEGYHPKNVNLVAPDAINCPTPLVLPADANCMAEVIVQTPISTCGNITFMSYTLPNGIVVTLSPPYPTTINLGVWSFGIYKLVWNVNDNCPPLPSSAVCSQTIVIDNQPPVITCPDDISVGNNEDGRRLVNGQRMMFTPVNVGQPTATDNCTPDADITYSHNSPYSSDPDDASGDYPLGTTIVCWTATDLSDNSASCCMEVTVFDNTPPEITCPDTLTVQCQEPSPYNYYTQFLAAGGIATDETSLDTSTFMFVVDSTTNLGCANHKTIKRFYKIGDTNGNMDTCFQIINVNDTTPPIALCKDITVNLEPNGMVTIAASELNNGSTDNCGGPLSFSSNQNLFFGCNDVAAGGKVTVILIVTDQCGNSATCSSTVMVMDLIPPTINCPQPITVNTNLGVCFADNVNLGNATSTDNCLPMNAPIPTFNGVTVVGTTQFPAGTNTVIWTVTDGSGNTATCGQVVTVLDNQNPTITCPPNLTVNSNASVCYANNVNLGTPLTSDNCGIQSIIPVFNGNPVTNITQFPVGVANTVTWTVTDVNGRTATCAQTVTVVDNQNPTITCPASITVNTNIGQCYANNVNLGAPSTTDNCGVQNTIARFNGSVVTNITQFPVNTSNIVTWTVTDLNGLTASCTQNVTVVDGQNPTIICPNNLTVNTNPGVCFANNVVLGNPTTTDNCPGQTSVPRLGAIIVVGTTQFVLGSNTVIWTVTDASGNTATCSQTITVVDNQNPTITCPINLTVNANANQCYASNVNLGTPTTADNCTVMSSSSSINGSSTSSSTQYIVGSNQVVWTVTDNSGRTATCTQTVTVVDNQNPTITCPMSITVNANMGQCYATNINLGTPTTSDNCGVQSTISRLNGNNITNTTQFPVSATNVVTWTVTDVNGRTATCTQNVSVVDNQNPTIVCPSNQEADLNNSCMLVVPDFRGLVGRSDNCTNTTITQSPIQGTTIASGHDQTHIFTFTVTDNAGLTATCSITVTSKDRLGPDIVCRQPRVLSISDEPEVSAYSFVSSAIDNCGGTLTYTARRMGNICGGNTPDDFGNYVQFCCDDVNKTITVIVQVTDSRGNSNTCMTTVVVQDKLAPTISTPLPDISISCEYLLNLNNLNAFGTLVPFGSPRQNIVINDPNTFYPPLSMPLQDGVFSDNCPGATVTSTFRNLLTMCNTGEIKRDFVVTDIAGNTATFTQTIFVIDVDKFDINDITWPLENVNFNDCNNANPPTSITGAPVINNDKCSQAAATYSDQSFAHPTYCKYIRRTWTVIDWCQYKTNVPNSPGKFTRVQNIYVTNNVAPTIAPKVCRDTIICTGNICEAKGVTFTAAGTDDCLPVNISWTYKIDLSNNGGTPDFQGTGAVVTKDYPMGIHKFTWEAKDGCSNTSTCSFLFTVKDCKAPSAVAMNGLAINLTAPMAMAEIWSSDFNNQSFDNCTPTGQLKYSFSADVNDRNRVYTCDSLGKRKVELWVTDLAGNQSKAVTFVTVQDNHGLCTSSGKIQISGSIYTEDRVKVADTKVQIDGGETEGSLMTDKEGSYTFNNLTMYNDYQLIPVKDDNYIDGITTLDLVLIQRHILGLKKLDSPYKLIAADANNSKSVTASDIVELRKLILGVNDKLVNNAPWRFVDAAYVFSDVNQPWPFAENLSYEVLETNMTTSDFIAVKLGDVNGSISENLTGKTQNRNNEKTELFIEEVILKAGELTNVPVTIKKSDILVGLQWTFELAPGLYYHGIEAEALNIKK